MISARTAERIGRLRVTAHRLTRALGLVWSAAPRLTLAWAGLIVIQAVLPVASVFLTRLLIDSVTATVAAGGTWPAMQQSLFYAGALAATLVTAQSLGVAGSWVRTAQAELVQDHLRTLVLRTSYAADLAFYESAEYHDHLERARSDASRRPLALLESGGSLVQNTITLVGMAALVAPYGWWVPTALAVSTLPALVVVVMFNRRFHDWWERTTADRRWATYHDWVLTYSEFAAEIRLFDLGHHFIEGYRRLRSRLRGERLALLRRENLATVGASLFALLVAGGAMIWMLLRVLRGLLTLGDLVLFYQAFDRGQSLMRSLLGNVGQIYANSLFLENLFEFLDLRPTIRDPDAPVPVPAGLTDGIRFRSITFTYPGAETTALDAFDLHVPAGGIVALVGSNGAGKSTVLKLLCRFYDPESGGVELDGIDLRRFALSDLRRALTVLFQDPVPYHASFRQNIAYGDLALDPATSRIEAAARAAGADEVAARLPRGYDTMLGKWFAYGSQLSGGEWQRIALARAFLRESPLLVLDEPTSFMDSWAEAEFLDRFRSLAAGRTSLIVTHRFTVAMRADIVHVMERGRIVESGSPAALLESGGRFAQSWQVQVHSGEERSSTIVDRESEV